MKSSVSKLKPSVRRGKHEEEKKHGKKLAARVENRNSLFPSEKGFPRVWGGDYYLPIVRKR